MKNFLFLFVFFILIKNTEAQTLVYAYRIVFKDKLFSPPLADSNYFFTQDCVTRRHKQHVLFTETDRPVSTVYIDSVMHVAQAFRLHNVSRWFNQVVVLTKVNNLVGLAALPFVDSVKLVGRYPAGWGFADNNGTTKPPTKYDYVGETVSSAKKKRGNYYGDAYSQIHVTRTDFLHNLGFKGKGVKVGVIDMGFSGIKLGAYDSINNSNRFIDKWNFVRDTINIDSFSIGSIIHGADALSCMGAEIPNFYVGSAPKANFALYITEDWAFESRIEEDNWVSAAERADSLGVQLLNTSLGYNQFDAYFSYDNYTYANHFNGHTTLIAQGANMATSKGIFCVTAMGNSGTNSWHYLVTPADADSVYSVGETDSFFNYEPSSSKGPNAAGLIKPDGVTVGLNVLIIDNITNGIKSTGGTSFSSPLLAGGIVCLMQALPKYTIYELKRLIHQCSSRYTSTSDTMGYGIPNFEMAYNTGIILNTKNLELGDNKTIALYPNPATNVLNINVGNKKINSISIFDITGKFILHQENASSVNIEQLPQGAYFTRIQAENTLYVKSFLIRK
jgi:serine protease AprX